MIRIAITGPESSGKTTLAAALAAHYQSHWCPEYSRDYLAASGTVYTLSDVVAINEGQLHRMADFVRLHAEEPFLFFDTETVVNRIWAEKKFGVCPQAILETAQQPRFDLYLLCYPDIDWEEDPLREDPFNRMELFEAYVSVLTEIGAVYEVIKGKGEQRLMQAVRLIHDHCM